MSEAIIKNLSMLVARLCSRDTGDSPQLRKSALDYLLKNGLMPSPLRGEEEPIKYVFEMVDSTSEEQYQTLGLFLTLEDAVRFLDGTRYPWKLSPEEHEEYCKIEIRRRHEGFCGVGETVFKREWIRDYNEDKLASEWIVVPARVLAPALQKR